MRFSLFYEHQLPRPWTAEAEHRLLKNALDQIEIADRVGFDYVWEVEHHFMEEYSHSSAPEVFLAAAAQRTGNIRIGHGIVQLPPAVNHPARVAERIATLDLVSDGRVDFGTGEASSAAELGGFGIRREDKRGMWQDAIDAITRMFVEEPFAGWDSEHFQMPVRNVVPKPLQRPHPPLWVACSRRETIHFAARNGIGALSFSFVEPEDAEPWVKEYYELIESPECVPAGFAVNPNVTVVLPMMCHDDEATAIERGIEGANYFGYSLFHYYGITPHQPARTNVWEEFTRRRQEMGFAKGVVNPDDAPLGVRVLNRGFTSVRGAIGTPEQITELIRRYEAAGVDQVGFVLQAGANRHEDICASLELFGEKVIPQFAAERPEREAAKAARLAPAIEAALARREPARTLPGPYTINEFAEVRRADRARRPAFNRSLHEVAASPRRLRSAAFRRGTQALGWATERRPAADFERLLRLPLADAVFFTSMARMFEPRQALGFEGDLQIELAFPATGRPPRVWTVRVRGKRATAVRGPSPDPRLTIRVPVHDLLRMGGGTNPGRVLLENRIDVTGDFAIAMRLPEMFGAPSAF